MSSSTPDVPHVHAEAGDALEEVEDRLALAEAVEHRGQRTDLHRAGREPDEVGADAVQLHHQDADRRGPLGDLPLDAEQPLDPEAVGRLVEDRREVVHARHEGDALGPGAELAALLDAGVQVADDDAGLGDRLAVELQHQPQHAVRGGVLRAHVDDDVVVLGLPVAEDALPVPTGDRVDAPGRGLGEAGLDGFVDPGAGVRRGHA
jgi:hypothetical protein